MQINTGKKPITLMMLLAIWSLSLGVNLPGLAVTPVEDELSAILHVSENAIQWLTVIPNLVIIPFVLLSGRFSLTRHKLLVITAGLIMYVTAAILYLISDSYTGLMLISILLGAGCGLLLPFSTGLIADVFTGQYRMRQMGIISGIGNISLVAATFAVGFLASAGWHAPFLVYLLPLICLVLLPWLRKLPENDADTADNNTAVQEVAPSANPTDNTGFCVANQKIVHGFYLQRTISLLLVYAFFEFANTTPAYYLSFVMADYHLDAKYASIVTSMIYLAMFFSGISLNSVLRVLRKNSFIYFGFIYLAGLVLFNFAHNLPLLLVASALIGFANGFAQPIFYDKATQICVDRKHATLALAFLQTANYVGISLVPVIINPLTKVFHGQSSSFPFIFITVLMAVVMVLIIVRIKHFTFGMSDAYYSDPSVEDD